jgi:hypothetical protein
MKRWILSLVFLVLLFTVSCSSKSAQSGGDTNNPSDLKHIFEIPSDPYSVTITLDPTIQAVPYGLANIMDSFLLT